MVDLSKCDTVTATFRFYARWVMQLNGWLRQRSGFHLPLPVLRWFARRLKWAASDLPGVRYRSRRDAERAWRARHASELPDHACLVVSHYELE